MITKDRIELAQKVLQDNGIEADETFEVLQAVCYVLLDIEIE